MFFWNKKIKELENEIIDLKNLNTLLSDSITKIASTQTIILGSVNKFTEADTQLLKKNKDWVELILKYLLYQIMLRTDSLRSKEDRDEKVWYINCLHEIYNFLEKLTRQEQEKEKYSWQNLK